MNSRDATNYLKGIAILAVLANHFINAYITDSMGGYANSLISIFFVLSGYGIYHSLIKRTHQPAFGLYASFLAKRLSRIYPLYWISYALKGFPDGILGLFALDFTAPQTLWFVPAIVQCYVVAPFLFVLAYRIPNKISIPVVLSVLAVLNIGFHSSGVEPVRTLAFQGIFFLQILQFYLGFMLAKTERYMSLNKYMFALSALSVLYFVNEATPHGTLHFTGGDYVLPLLLSVATFVMCASLLSSKISLPSQKMMIFVGGYSYSIYLFHGIQFRIFSTLGVLEKGSTHGLGILLSLLTLPFFILVYAAFETVTNELIFGDRNFRRAFEIFKQRLLPAT